MKEFSDSHLMGSRLGSKVRFSAFATDECLLPEAAKKDTGAALGSGLATSASGSGYLAW